MCSIKLQPCEIYAVKKLTQHEMYIKNKRTNKPLNPIYVMVYDMVIAKK